jgi:hypothetical protein
MEKVSLEGLVHQMCNVVLHCKKRLALFPSPAGMSQTKLTLAGIKTINGVGIFIYILY